MSKNRLIVAAAGSGKTTYIISQASEVADKGVLITTYTLANEAEIRRKFHETHGCIPAHITIQTWFSLLLQHGIRPYQTGVFEKGVAGLNFVSERSSKYSRQDDIENHYFDKSRRVYSDKLAKLVLLCNERHKGEVLARFRRIYGYVFVDEVQDMSAYDLDLLKQFIEVGSDTVIVGDPRQKTYSTSNAQRNSGFKNVVDFFQQKDMQQHIEIDSKSLTKNWRSNKTICDYSNLIYPDFPQTSSGQLVETGHDGLFLVRESDVPAYLIQFPDSMQLIDSIREKRASDGHKVMNFGVSKGLEFDRVLIFPTKPIEKWMLDQNSNLAAQSRSRFYVAVTRSKHSVAIVYNFKDGQCLDHFQTWFPG